MLVDFEAQMEARDIIERLFADLSDCDCDVLVARLIYGVTLREVGADYGVGKEQARKKELFALRRARRWLARFGFIEKRGLLTLWERHVLEYEIFKIFGGL